MSEYFAQSEPEDYKKRSYNWKIAIGLQAIDGLVPSQYLLDIANLNIKGELPLYEIQQNSFPAMLLTCPIFNCFPFTKIYLKTYTILQENAELATFQKRSGF